VIVRAPGKAMLIGEYAVLEGGPAVVAAVDCYADARLEPSSQGRAQASPFIVQAEAEAQAELQRRGLAVSGLPVVNTAAFSQNGRKLGLGSSAAATVAAVGALFQAAGVDLDDRQNRVALHGVARRAHDAAQGVPGSGADVLAAVFGGLQTLNSDGDVRELQLPGELLLRLVPTSTSASTAELVARYRSVGAAVTPARQRMIEAARRFIAACRDGDAGALLAAVAAAQEAFLALGRILDRELVTDEHRAIASAATRAGGVAKPSGAGGGDLAVVFLPIAAVAPFEKELTPLPFAVSARGVHLVSTLEQS
jgi:mevalonate kinase